MRDLDFTEKLFGRPLTRTGWWAVGLEAIFVALLSAMIAWGSRARWGLDPLANLLAAATALSAIAAGVVSGIGIFRLGERSLGLIFILFAGSLVLAFSTAELLGN